MEIRKNSSRNSNYERIIAVSHWLPSTVLQDIGHRYQDWVSSGGKDADPYAGKLAKYAEDVAEQVKRQEGWASHAED